MAGVGEERGHDGGRGGEGSERRGVMAGVREERGR